MSRPISRQNHKSEENIQKEYFELQKRYKNIEQDRKAYNEETQANFKKQRNLVEKLQKENQSLKEDLENYDKAANKNFLATQQVKYTVQEEIRMIKQKIETEEKKQIEMDEQVKILQEDIIQEKMKLGGINATHESYHHIQKQIRILENRLDKANQKFNEAIAHNKKLREQIDSLRRERVIFDSIYRKLEKELHSKRKEMAGIIEQANSAYEDRDTAQDQLATLIQKAERDKNEYDKDFAQMNALMERNREMRDFIKTKETEKFEQAKASMDQLREEESTKKKESWGVTTSKTQGYTLAKKIQYYEDVFAKIQAATGITDIDELIKNFIQEEEKNFHMFKFVNNLSNEIELLEPQIEEMREELSQYEGQGMKLDNKREITLKKLEEKLKKTELKAEQYESKYQKCLKTINSLKSGIENAFNTIETRNICGQDVLGAQGVTESNMITYLALIEKRRTDIFQAFTDLLEAKVARGQDPVEGAPKFVNVFNFLASGPKRETEDLNVKVEPPVIQDYKNNEELSEEEDEFDKAIPLEEFKRKMENQIDHQGITVGSSRSKAKPRKTK